MALLVVLRHAQAEPVGASSDHARPLTARGEDEARAVGRALRERGISPDVVVSSDAARARRTAELVVADEAWPLVEDPDVYEASPARLGAVLERHAAAATTTVLVCHEPGASGLSVALAGPSSAPGAADRRAQVLAGLGTACAAVLRWDDERAQLLPASADLVDVLGP
ncbi:histidine phosphatase family protein [Pseudokineococcus marinus]|uniref:SixA phosphatase family protein n=1 Tax=Pseudokineococcus marinus TaxID=351215 RepID=UPI001BB2ED7B|nr:histidine phosphatase family protein [Pseudokineococcus marinus]